MSPEPVHPTRDPMRVYPRDQAPVLCTMPGFHQETMLYGCVRTIFGCYIAAVSQGMLCMGAFVDPEADLTVWSEALQHRWRMPVARSDLAVQPYVAALFAPEPATLRPVLRVHDAAFAPRVWQQLLWIPRGQRWTYAQLARAVGAPGATRAVVMAVRNNPIAVGIPCHRVVRSTGAIGGYSWGIWRKQLLLAYEAGDTIAPLCFKPAVARRAMSPILGV